jgi:predicted alpha/beta hydrolase family esterase
MPNQKRIFIVHGWAMSSTDGWYPWLAKNLKDIGFSAEVPEMPDTDNPKIETWVSHIQKIVGQCDEDTFFVGHSIGCQAIMRYFEKLSSEERAEGAIFVAPWLTLSNIEGQEERMISSPWINTPVDFEKVRNNAKKFICIFSDNDPYVPLKNVELFSKKLGAEVVMEKGKGHFAREDRITELGTAMDALLKILG